MIILHIRVVVVVPNECIRLLLKVKMGGIYYRKVNSIDIYWPARQAVVGSTVMGRNSNATTSVGRWCSRISLFVFRMTAHRVSSIARPCQPFCGATKPPHRPNLIGQSKSFRCKSIEAELIIDTSWSRKPTSVVIGTRPIRLIIGKFLFSGQV